MSRHDSEPPIRIRNAGPDEVEAIADLVVRAYEEFAPRMAGGHWTQMSTNLRGLAREAPLPGLIVAEIEGAMAGTVSYHPAGSSRGTVGFTRFPPEWALMKILAVDPGFRGRGVGAALAQEVVDRARSDGAKVIGLHTSDLMVAARSIYGSLGFELQEEFQRLGLEFGVYRLLL